jgi:hypothetical protein
MSDFKDRLVIEKNGLDERIEKLEAFIAGASYVKIEAIQQSLLNIQVQAMHTYSQCVLERIAWLDFDKTV